MSAAASGANLAGGFLSAIGALKQGQSAQAAGQYNADMDFFNQTETLRAKDIAVNQNQRQSAMGLGKARAQYGASGVESTSGSALDVLMQSASQAALDTEILKHKYDVAAYGYGASGRLSLFKGDGALENSYYSAAGAILGGAGSAASGMGGSKGQQDSGTTPSWAGGDQGSFSNYA